MAMEEHRVDTHTAHVWLFFLSCIYLLLGRRGKNIFIPHTGTQSNATL